MEEILSLATIAIFIFTCFGCQNNKKNSDLEQAARVDSLQQIVNQKDNEIDDIVDTLNKVQEGFKEVNTTENRVAITREGEDTNRGQRVREDIQFIASIMKCNREPIAKLRNRLKQGFVKGNGLKKALDSLTARLEKKDKQLQELYTELDAKNTHISKLGKATSNLNTSVSSLVTRSSQKSRVISSQDKQLNIVWFVFGTRKELKEQRIVEGDKVLQVNSNKDYFAKIDTRVNKETKLYSKSVKVLTMHPSSSYLSQRDASEQYVLRITDPEIFWSISKHLVILMR